ncbi:MAG: hypothetical protein JWP78_659 [Mucilaginibacter sp.]|nr:hypothetical protein [Mucilaginibacter sp.]
MMTISIFSFQSEQNRVGKATVEKLPYETKNTTNRPALKGQAEGYLFFNNFLKNPKHGKCKCCTKNT